MVSEDERGAEAESAKWAALLPLCLLDLLFLFFPILLELLEYLKACGS